MRNKTKKTLKGILGGALCVASIIGTGAVINNMVNRADEDGLVKVHLNYDIGGLDANGEFEETDASIYTKNAFEAQGLKVEVDFDSTVDYELFFYDKYGDFISSTGALEKNFDDEIPLVASHARIEITPKADEDGIKWYEKSGYASQLTIKVNEKQEYNLTENLFKIDPKLDGSKWYGLSSNSTLTAVESSDGTYSSAFVDCTEYSKLIVGIVRNGNGEQYNFENIYFGTDVDNNKLATIQAKCADSDDVKDIVYQEIEIPDGATRFAINYNARTINGTFVYGVK